MLFKKNNNQVENPTKDQVAQRIANALLNGQRVISEKMNKQVNRVSQPHQKTILCVFCLAWMIVLGLSIYRLQQVQPVITENKNVTPTHIGQSSDIPRPDNYHKRTDSLTIKH